MTSWTVLIGVLAVLVLSLLVGWMASDLLALRRRVTGLEEALRVQPVRTFREPEPGSYALSDAEAAQVEHEQMVESRQRAVTRKAAGWPASNVSWRRG